MFIVLAVCWWQHVTHFSDREYHHHLCHSFRCCLTSATTVTKYYQSQLWTIRSRRHNYTLNIKTETRCRNFITWPLYKNVYWLGHFSLYSTFNFLSISSFIHYCISCVFTTFFINDEIKTMTYIFCHDCSVHEVRVFVARLSDVTITIRRVYPVAVMNPSKSKFVFFSGFWHRTVA